MKEVPLKRIEVLVDPPPIEYPLVENQRWVAGQNPLVPKWKEFVLPDSPLHPVNRQAGQLESRMIDPMPPG